MAPSPPPSRGTAQAGSKARLFEHRDVRVRAGPACAAATRKTARSRKDRAAAVPGASGVQGAAVGPLLGPAEGRNENALQPRDEDDALGAVSVHQARYR